MKVKYFLFSIIVAAFLSSAIAIDNRPEIGESAPKIETIEGLNVVNDTQTRGKSKLISFWNPKNPESRINNKKLSKKYGLGNDEVEFISICTDSDSLLMEEVLKIDGITADQSFAFSEISPRAFKDYDVIKAPKAFLISDSGKILQIL